MFNNKSNKRRTLGLGTGSVCNGSSNLLAVVIYWLTRPVYSPVVFILRTSEKQTILDEVLRKPIKCFSLLCSLKDLRHPLLLLFTRSFLPPVSCLYAERSALPPGCWDFSRVPSFHNFHVWPLSLRRVPAAWYRLHVAFLRFFGWFFVLFSYFFFVLSCVLFGGGSLLLPCAPRVSYRSDAVQH